MHYLYLIFVLFMHVIFVGVSSISEFYCERLRNFNGKIYTVQGYDYVATGLPQTLEAQQILL